MRWTERKRRWCGRCLRGIRTRARVCGGSRSGSTRRKSPRANAHAGIRPRSPSCCAIRRIAVAPVLAKRRSARDSGSRDADRCMADARRGTRPITIVRGASGWRFSCRRSSARRRSPWPRSGWCRTSTSRGDGRSPPRCYTACWCASSVAIACIGGGGIIAAGRRRVSPHRHGPACYESSCATSPFGCARVGRGHSPVR